MVLSFILLVSRLGIQQAWVQECKNLSDSNFFRGKDVQHLFHVSLSLSFRKCMKYFIQGPWEIERSVLQHNLPKAVILYNTSVRELWIGNVIIDWINLLWCAVKQLWNVSLGSVSLFKLPRKHVIQNAAYICYSGSMDGHVSSHLLHQPPGGLFSSIPA